MNLSPVAEKVTDRFIPVLRFFRKKVEPCENPDCGCHIFAPGCPEKWALETLAEEWGCSLWAAYRRNEREKREENYVCKMMGGEK